MGGKNPSNPSYAALENVVWERRRIKGGISVQTVHKVSWEGINLKRPGYKKTLALLTALTLAIAGGAHLLEDNMSQPMTAFASVRFPDRQLILDAGHGGEDGGAVSVTGVPESEINLAITLKLDQLLGFYGVSPMLLRESDRSLHDESAKTIREKKVSDLHNRVAIINGTEDAVVVSIHQNTFPDPSLHGCQVFYRAEGESQTLAELVQESIRQHLDEGNHRKAAKIPNSVYLMKNITCPAILVECGFLSNVAEEARLSTNEYQDELAACIAAGVLKNEINRGETPKSVL